MFTVNGIDKLLYNLVPSKATGPDRIPACILKQYATELAPHLAHILNISLAQGDILTAGVKQMIHLYSKKGKSIWQVITNLFH